MRQRNGFLSLVVLAIGLLLVSGCKRDEDEEPAPTDTSFNVRLEFHMDGVPLEFDTMKYQTAAGYPYSVDRLQFYLSEFEFERSDGSSVSSDEWVYVDVADGKGIQFKLEDIPQGTYNSVHMHVGLDSLLNITGALPNTLENMNMAWPTMMGGGYHFMKFEGYYTSNDTAYGFAMHMGKNQHLVHVLLNKNMAINSASDTLKLKMNLNEWFKNPHIYDFNIDGSGSMYNDAAMLKLKENGSDVFNE